MQTDRLFFTFVADADVANRDFRVTTTPSTPHEEHLRKQGPGAACTRARGRQRGGAG